jgi:hypothetical protein
MDILYSIIIQFVKTVSLNFLFFFSTQDISYCLSSSQAIPVLEIYSFLAPRIFPIAFHLVKPFLSLIIEVTFYLRQVLVIQFNHI